MDLVQTERLIAKVQRLEAVYGGCLIASRTPLSVTAVENGRRRRMKEGQTWGGPFVCAEFFASLPAASDGWLECDDGAVENLIEVDGKPVGMTDFVANAREPEFRVHRYAPLGRVKRGAKLRVEAYASHPVAGTQPYDTQHTFSLRSREDVRVFRSISLVTFDPAAKEFFDALALLNGLYRAAAEDDPVRTAAYPVYEELFRILPLSPERRPDDGQFRKASACIGAYLSALPKAGETPYIGLVGHSHLDTAWLWTVEETRRKAMRTVANAVTLLKKYPSYRFLFSTVLYLDWIKRDSPALFEDIRALVKEGRFEPNGSTWVECDCNLTGGEALVRQFVRGKRFLRREFGYEADTFWLPDTFGYSAALPQILQKCGVKYFLTTKLSWNDTNEFPYDAFVWQGIDGSAVTVHFNTTQSDALPAFLKKRISSRKEKHLNDCALVAYGYGDGGGGPSDEMVRRACKTAEIFPWAKTEHTSVSAFMEKLSARPLPRYCGELYLELHRGTLTVHHDIKRNNRRLEGALHDAEFLSVAAGKPEWKGVTDECYDVLMLNQFHDILPGTCIGEVNDISLRETGEAISRLHALWENGGETYINTLCFPRTELVECADGDAASYPDFDGNIRRAALYSFPPFGKGTRIPPSSIRYEDGVVRTPFYTARFENGEIVSLVCGGREVAAGHLNALKACECIPYRWDNWDIDADYPFKEEPVRPVSTEVISSSGAEVRIRNRYAFGESTLVSDTVLYAHSPEIRFVNRLDFREPHGMLRAYFPTNLVASASKSAVQFGYLERSVHRSTSVEQARFEVCNHKWSDLSETRFGLALLNDCKYGFSCEEGTLSLTLAKSGTHPDPRGDFGVKEFTYSLLPHEGGFAAESVVFPAEALNAPPVRTSLLPVSPIRAISRPNIICETVKFGEEGGIVLRLYECECARTRAELCLNETFEIHEADLLEEPTNFLGRHDRLELEWKPFEIKTLILKKLN